MENKSQSIKTAIKKYKIKVIHLYKEKQLRIKRGTIYISFLLVVYPYPLIFMYREFSVVFVIKFYSFIESFLARKWLSFLIFSFVNKCVLNWYC